MPEAMKGSVEFREHEVTGGKQVATVLDPEETAVVQHMLI